jgi:hypothetical protein
MGYGIKFRTDQTGLAFVLSVEAWHGVASPCTQTVPKRNKVVMTQFPSKFQRAKPRSKTKPARRVILSEEERRKLEEAATEMAKKDEAYTRHLPTDSTKR